MVKVRVRMFATIREAAGTSEYEMEASGLPDLMDKLGTKFGERLLRILKQAEKDPDRLVILVNGKNIGRFGGRTESFGEGDEIAIFPPVSGG